MQNGLTDIAVASSSLPKSEKRLLPGVQAEPLPLALECHDVVLVPLANGEDWDGQLRGTSSSRATRAQT
jgi:hypothetical protein